MYYLEIDLILYEIHSNTKCNRTFDRTSKIHLYVESMIEEIQVEGFFYSYSLLDYNRFIT
jgi:hypothetical protein